MIGFFQSTDFLRMAQIFTLVFVILTALQPMGMFNEYGAPRRFGMGPGETLLPAWLVAVIAALYATQF